MFNLEQGSEEEWKKSRIKIKLLLIRQNGERSITELPTKNGTVKTT